MCAVKDGLPTPSEKVKDQGSHWTGAVGDLSSLPSRKWISVNRNADYLGVQAVSVSRRLKQPDKVDM
jgi:hypothetical protein